MEKYMKYLIPMLLCFSVTVQAATAFYTGERRDGMNKICFYKSVKGNTAITIKATAICPRTIQV